MKDKTINFLREHKDKKYIRFFDQLIYKFFEEGTLGNGAQMAYFLTLSIFPFLIALINLIQFTTFVNKDVIIEALAFLPEDVNQYLIPFVYQTTVDSLDGIVSIIAALGGLWTASSAVNRLVRLIERSYGEDNQRPFLVRRIIALFFTVALLILIVLFVAASIVGSKIGLRIFEELNILKFYQDVWKVFEPIFFITYMIIVFTLFYWFSISKKSREDVNLSEIIPGALFSTVLLLLTSKFFDIYVANINNFSIYGSLGGIIILLVWLYVLGIILILGGQINATLTNIKLNEKNEHPSECSFIEKYLVNPWL